MGGTLYQDIEDHWQDCSAEYTTQRLMTEPNTVLREIWEKFPISTPSTTRASKI